MGEQKTRDNVQEDRMIKRPPHFNQGPVQRTEHDVGGYTDYPSAEEEQDYQDKYDFDGGGEDERLAVDIGQHVPQREVQEWAVARHLVQEEHVRIAGREDNRRRLFLRNGDDTNSVFIGKGQTDSAFTMFELAPGESLELWHQSSVWAVCNTGETAYVSLANEFVPAEEPSL